MLGEDRYRSLKNLNRDSDSLLSQNKKDAEDTYFFYKNLENKEVS